MREVAAQEAGVVRLFRIDLPAAEIDAFMANDRAGYDADGAGAEAPSWPLREALGAEYLDEGFVEVVAVKDIAGLGLAGYLAEGMGIPEEDLAADRAMLDALEGHVLVVGSPAFGGLAQALDPQAPLEPVGLYREAPVRPVIGRIESAAAKGRLARRSTHVVHHHASTIRTLMVLMAALLLGGGIVAMLALGLS